MTIDKEVIWRLLAAARKQYALETSSSCVELNHPNLLLTVLADSLEDCLVREDKEAIEVKVEYERQQFPDLAVG
jgi:hypothetical protein